jgi:hypothetical protein
VSEENSDLTHDLTLLGAVETRVLEVMTDTAWPETVHLPITVQARHAREAFLSFACAATFIHGRTQDGEELPLTDVIAFPGDARRLKFLGASSAAQYFNNFSEFSNQLRGLYASSASRYTRAISDSGWLDVNQAIWLATYLRLTDPSRANDLVLDFVRTNPTLGRGLNA